MGSPLCDHLARPCIQCLHSETVKHHDDSRILLCNNRLSPRAVLQCLDRGSCLCQTCDLNPNIFSPFFLLQNGSNSNSTYDCLDFDSSSSSCSSSFVDRDLPVSCGSLPLITEDSSSYFESFQIDENYTKNNHSGQQVPMLQPDNLDIPKDSSCSGFNGYETKEDIDNVLPNTFDGEAVLDIKEYHPDKDLIITDPQIDELTKHNAETLLVDQGACWSFSATGTMEGINKIVTGDLISLSEQELIDYDKSYYAGCNDGLMDYAFEFLIKNHGIDTEKDYPYQEHDGTSTKDKLKQRVVTIDSYADVKSNDEKALMEAVAAQPVSVGICGSERAFQLYSSASNVFGPAELGSRLSQLILTDEMLPWENQTYLPVKRYSPQARKEALKRYFAKKKKRKFGKQIRYESRKSTADTKRRMKGRFTKAGAEYDYDPRTNNIKKGTNKITS